MVSACTVYVFLLGIGLSLWIMFDSWKRRGKP
jgi:hypothetical protein